MRPVAHLLACTTVLVAGGAAQGRWDFEAPVSHGLALSPRGDRLFAVDAPGSRLTVFSLADPRHPAREREIAVGLEPVAVAARGDDEVWVACWLSDAVQKISLAKGIATATVRVGDEPGDLVFAGDPARLFVSVTGERALAVIDPDAERVVARVALPADAPRALCRSADGARVFAAALRSGNGTTVAPGGTAPLPPAPTAADLPSAPREGLVVRADDPAWAALGVTLADEDVFGVDAATLAVVERHRGVGTTLFDVACDPVSGDLWVANTEARNLVRFEPNVRGHAVDHRVTRIARPGGEVVVHDLDPVRERDLALAEPTALCFAPDGARIFVAAHGSDRVAVLDRDGRVVARIEVAPPAARRSPARMRGPRALVHHPREAVLYVHNRVASTLAVVDTGRGEVVGEQPLGPDATPPASAAGRGFLYSAWIADAGLMSCSSCHVDADWDGLAWDLGDPGGAMQTIENKNLYPLRVHPMKGPMTTQTLRGLTATAAPFHHRGDRASLRDFNPAFGSLVGGQPLAEPDLAAFVGFLQQIRFPSNPHRTLDNRYAEGPRPAGVPSGAVLFDHPPIGHTACSTCHTGPATTNGLIVTGHLLQFQAQAMKTAQLRDVYKRTAREPRGGARVGGFGVAHDGSVDGVEAFLSRPFFRDMAPSAEVRAELARFVRAMDTGTSPAVGWVCTAKVAADVPPDELALVEAEAAARHCDLVVRGRLGGEACGYRFAGEDTKYVDGGAALSRAELLARLVAGDAITFLGQPPPRE